MIGLPTADDVLAFWFGNAPLLDARPEWFTKSDAFDAEIRARFLPLWEALSTGDADTWMDTPLEAIARIVVLDQFSRNIHRGTPRAFAADPKALALARRVVAAGWDAQLPSGHHRAFAYLPFEHDESVESQREAVRLCAGIRDEAGCESYHRFALLHAAVVERFGRFPHRNAILGRASSDEETAFLREPGSSF